MTIKFMHIADLVDSDDPQGRTYRQINAEKKHNIPVGALVEDRDGVRLFVVYQGRDCDMTPLYWLSPHKDDTEQDDPRFARGKYGPWYGGYPEDSLMVIKRGDQQ